MYLLPNVWEYLQFSEHTHPVRLTPQFGYLAVLHPEQDHRLPIGVLPRGSGDSRIRVGVGAGHHEVRAGVVVLSDLMLYGFSSSGNVTSNIRTPSASRRRRGAR